MNVIGNKFLADFGMAKAILHLENDTVLTFTIIEKNGAELKDSETVEVKLTELRPRLYMLTWKEKSGVTVTQIQDHEQEKVYNSWTQPGGEFTQATGTLKPML
jgi:hypothetical protein